MSRTQVQKAADGVNQVINSVQSIDNVEQLKAIHQMLIQLASSIEDKIIDLEPEPPEEE